MNNHCAISDDHIIIQWLYRETTGKNNRKGYHFKVLLLVSISKLNSMIPLKQLCNSEHLGKFK